MDSGATKGQAEKRWLKQNKLLAGQQLKYSVALGTCSALLLIAQAWLLAQTLQGVMFDSKTLDDIAFYLWGILALIVLRSILTRATERYAFKAAARIKRFVREQLNHKLFELGPVWLEGQRTGEISSLLHEGVESLEDYYARYLPAVAFSSLIPIAILVVVIPFDWKSGLIFLFTLPLIPFFMILIGTKTEALNQQRWRDLFRMGSHFLDVIQGLTQLKLFNASKREAATIASISDAYRHSTMSVLKVAFLSSLALEFLATVSIAMVAITIGFRLYWGTLDFSSGFMVLLLAPEFYAPLRNLGAQYHARLQAVTAAGKMIEVLQTESSGFSAIETIEPSTAQPLHIELRNFHYRYSDDRPALKGLNTCFERTGLYAIVGQSGAGKSTLLDCLLGFNLPYEGSIAVNQKVLSVENIPHWQEQIAWVPQQARLLSASISMNISMCENDTDAKKIKYAAELAGADEFIQALPAGYYTSVGEGGHGLSGGQIQRLALARAFYKRAALLLLDEPTAHLDSVSEASIQKAIQWYAKDHLVIVAAHRLHTVKHAKKILVLHEGMLVEEGSHHALIEQSGLYSEFVALANVR
ncbi:MAG: thiol reductant ABC exporter subunit CydD [Pseudomonadales bacterium]|nr:thiol reductant ABC exporter subunit CydD [Pseudomonadales bacterium]